MDLTKLTAFVSLLLAVSIAAERLVEIIKGLIPPLAKEDLGKPNWEHWRKFIIHLLAVGAGILTAYLLPASVLGESKDLTATRLCVGLLASGGSSFWNSILSYLNLVKKAKLIQVANLKAAAKANQVVL